MIQSAFTFEDDVLPTAKQGKSTILNLNATLMQNLNSGEHLRIHSFPSYPSGRALLATSFASAEFTTHNRSMQSRAEGRIRSQTDSDVPGLSSEHLKTSECKLSGRPNKLLARLFRGICAFKPLEHFWRDVRCVAACTGRHTSFRQHAPTVGAKLFVVARKSGQA